MDGFTVSEGGSAEVTIGVTSAEPTWTLPTVIVDTPTTTVTGVATLDPTGVETEGDGPFWKTY